MSSTVMKTISPLQYEQVLNTADTDNTSTKYCDSTFDIHDIKSTCIKILNAGDHDKSLTSNDSEGYEGENDSNISTCLTISQTLDV